MPSSRRPGGRTTPKGTRPSHLRPMSGGRGRPPERNPLHDMIESGAHELLAEASAVAAETWASGLLHLFAGVASRAVADGQQAPPVAEGLLDACAERTDRAGAVIAAAFAAVAPPEHQAAARQLADRLIGAVADVPEWVRLVGHAEATRAWAASDPWGDQESLVVAFRQPGEAGEHALVALIDHTMAGRCRDLWVADDADEARDAWSQVSDDGVAVTELTVLDGLRRLREGMAATDFWDAAPDDDAGRLWAMAWARLRRAGFDDGPPTPRVVTPAERDAIVADFVASPEGRALIARVSVTEVDLLAHALVGLRADVEGRPLRWSPMVVNELLLDLIPRKVLVTDDQTHTVPEVVRAFVRYAGRRSGLAPGHVAATLEAVDEAEAEFSALATNPAAADPAKAIMAELIADGVDIGDADALRAALAERLGPPLREEPDAPQPWPALPPPASATAEVLESAAAAPALARFAAIAGFYGAGRKLTAKGHPTLADARQLLELLGLDERLEQTWGSTTVSRRSAGELPQLRFLLRWARAAGVVRVQQGKLLAVAAWTGRPPVEQWLRAVAALVELGPLESWHEGHPFHGGDEPLDVVAPELLARLAGAGADASGVAAADLVDGIAERVDELFVDTSVGVWADADFRRRLLQDGLERLLDIFSDAGLVTWRGRTPRAADDWHSPEALDGTVALTPAGRWLVGR